MCGIIGYVGTDARARPAQVSAARDTMIHRGPDDAGIWVDDSACLGARRLAILDLTDAGHMPMSTLDGRYTLVFNGAIYNFVELRRELERHVTLRSTGDTEVILQGFRVWGWPALLDRLEGMFAFALWDARERVLLAARDRMGEKPLFHGRIGQGFGFASTLAALSRLRGSPATVDARALDAYLTYQAVPAPLSMYDGLSQLRPAHALRFDAASGELSISRYWDVAYAPKRRVTEAEALEEIDRLARRSVGQRLRSDVPTGTLLSGGVDSSLITALAATESPAPLEAVTMGYAERDFDERRYARLVAERYGVRLHEEILAPALVADLPAIIGEYGQPVADVSIVPHYYLARAARRHMKVALVGDGADELFGGYARPMTERVAPLYRRLLPGSLRRLLDRALGDPPGRRSSTRWGRALALLARAGRGSARDSFVYDRAFRSLRETAYTDSLRAALGGWDPDPLNAEAWDRAVAHDDVDRALYGDLTTYLPDQLLAKADVSSMAHGLESRAPFLARELVEYAATLPNALRLKRFTTKYLLKRVAERYVPTAAIRRRKRGFVMPISLWLRGELAPYAAAALDSDRFHDRGWIRGDVVRRLLREHRSGDRDWGEQIWTLMVLEVWARIALDGSLRPEQSLEVLRSERRAP